MCVYQVDGVFPHLNSIVKPIWICWKQKKSSIENFRPKINWSFSKISFDEETMRAATHYPRISDLSTDCFDATFRLESEQRIAMYTYIARIHWHYD